MTVFKYFFKVVKEYKFTIILYTVILIGFAAFNFSTNETSTNFFAAKPDILIIDNDNSEISENLKKYFEKHTNLKHIENDEEKQNDALFYRDVSLIIKIPKDYGKSILEKQEKEIEIKSTNDIEAEYATMLLERYLKVSNSYKYDITSKENFIENINKTLESNIKVKMGSKLDTKALDKAAFFYNFANYCLLAGCVFVISTVINSFKSNSVDKRTIISGVNYKKYNFELFKASCIYGILLWILYITISLFLLGKIMFTIHGLLFLINSFIFMFCSVTISFIMTTLINDKEALNSIVNIIALGSSFLCGAFVPMEFLPETVLKIAHILPSYWFIKNNELIKNIDTITKTNLNQFIINLSIMICFIISISIINNLISKRKQTRN